MMIFYFFVTCFSFILLLKPRPGSSDFTQYVSKFALKLKILLIGVVFSKDHYNHVSATTSCTTTPSVNRETTSPMLDLPELALDSILERLPPEGLRSMAGVCSSLRERCISDDLWEKHMKQKWSKIIGPAASREWRIWLHDQAANSSWRKKWWFVRVASSLFWHLCSWVDLDPDDDEGCYKWANRPGRLRSGFPSHKVAKPPCGARDLGLDSRTMEWYLALESGRFWFPAQVYNRENGHVGFLLSCYDADLSYDPRTDTFQARYPPHGRRPVTVETGVQWQRLRAIPLDISCSSSTPHLLHVSDCLADLRPGDHIEIQWRRNKDFPYGWWYGVVGHLQECDGIQQFCWCHNSETVVLEFHQYAAGSRWRQTTVKRTTHREEGNEASGFYGGIRKLTEDDEIGRWKLLWPPQPLR